MDMLKKPLLILIINCLIAFWSTASDAWLVYHKPALEGKVVDAETKEPIVGALVVIVYNKHPIIGGPGGSWNTVINIRETFTDKNGDYRFDQYTTLMHPLSKEGQIEILVYKPGYKKTEEFTIDAFTDGLAFSSLSETLLRRIDDKWKAEFEEYLKKVPEKERSRLSRGKNVQYFFRYLTFLPMKHAKEKLQTFNIPFFEVPNDINLDRLRFLEREDLYSGNILEKSKFTLFGIARTRSRDERLKNIPSLPEQLQLLDKQRNLIRIINEEEESLGLQKSDPYKAREYILRMGK